MALLTEIVAELAEIVAEYGEMVPSFAEIEGFSWALGYIGN